MYRYFLDSTVLNPPGSDPQDEPQGWSQLVTTIKRDRTLKGILKTIDAKLSFGGLGYSYLKNIFDTQTFCGQVVIKIQKSCDDGNTFTDYYNGLIFISDIEFDEKRCLAHTKIQDNSFYAKINNNKSQDCLFHVGKTKNGEDIDVVPIKKISFFEPSSGSYYPVLIGTDHERTCVGYKIYDCLNFLIQFMTDSSMSFDSITFGSGGDFENVLLTYGLVVSTVTTGLSTADFEENFPRLNFQKVFQELDRLINIGFYVDYSTSDPTFFIESQDKLYSTSIILSTPDVDELKTSTATDYLYSKLNIGSNIFNDAPQLAYPEDINWISFKAEEYNVLGTCNLDRTLDLTRDFVVDSNCIEDAVVNGSTVNDDSVFIIHCDSISGSFYHAHQSNVLTNTPPPYYYNEIFTNDKIANRYIGGIPNSLNFWTGNTNNKFQATKNTLTNIAVPPVAFGELKPVIYQDDSTGSNFDPGSNYDPATGEFTVPLGGQYTFYSLAKVGIMYSTNILGGSNGIPMTFRIVLRRYDNLGVAGGNELYNIVISNNNVIINEGTLVNFDYSGSGTMNLAAGDKIIISTDLQTGSSFITSKRYVLKQGSQFACVNDVTSGGTFKFFDPADYSVLIHSYDYPFSDSDKDAILNDVRGTIRFSRADQQTRVGWIEQIKFNEGTGKMDVILNSNKKINGH